MRKKKSWNPNPQHPIYNAKNSTIEIENINNKVTGVFMTISIGLSFCLERLTFHQR